MRRSGKIFAVNWRPTAVASSVVSGSAIVALASRRPPERFPHRLTNRLCLGLLRCTGGGRCGSDSALPSALRWRLGATGVPQEADAAGRQGRSSAGTRTTRPTATCCATHAATSSPMTATTRERSRGTSATDPSSRPRGTPHLFQFSLRSRCTAMLAGF
jgi:hypothetical protein